MRFYYNVVSVPVIGPVVSGSRPHRAADSRNSAQRRVTAAFTSP